MIDSRMFVPTKAFLTKGVGRHKEKLTSFEMALRDAHLANFNLVRVSSIFPPECELVDREEGLSVMKPALPSKGLLTGYCQPLMQKFILQMR